MSRPIPAGMDNLVGPLLRSVSRSFYLSVRFLPSELRDPVGLAYLLARATDTIADTSQIASGIRKPKLETLSAVIQGRGGLHDIDELRNSFAPLQTNADERRLIESLPECLRALEECEASDLADIRDLLSKITRAQLLDVERFGATQEIQALVTEAELNEYTYLIAGCVGEFWTRICDRHMRHFAELPVAEMLDLGRRYGAGLQLINILRDAGGDLRAGRCYLPNDELGSVGLTPNQILESPAKFMILFRKWIDRAEEGLNAGMKYSLAVRSRRIRAATALPALIGARTIALLREAGDAVLEEKIKVPRSEVRRMVRALGLGLASKRTMERLFRKN